MVHGHRGIHVPRAEQPREQGNGVPAALAGLVHGGGHVEREPGRDRVDLELLVTDPHRDGRLRLVGQLAGERRLRPLGGHPADGHAEHRRTPRNAVPGRDERDQPEQHEAAERTRGVAQGAPARGRQLGGLDHGQQETLSVKSRGYAEALWPP